MKVKKRRISQIVFLALLNLPFIGPWTQVCVPVLNCHSCPWAVFSCPIGILGHFMSWGIFPFYALGLVVLFGAIFGAFFCGWVCPFGLLQDLLHKIPSPKRILPRWTARTKYVVLIGSVFLVPFFIGLETRLFFCKLCPVGTLESLIPRTISSGKYDAFIAAWPRLLALLLVLVFVVVARRGFCKTLCPIGAMLSICNKFSALSLRYKGVSCPKCELCLDDCPMDVRIEDFQTGDGDSSITVPANCVMCLNCVHTCHRAGLSQAFWNLFPRNSRESVSLIPAEVEDQNKKTGEDTSVPAR